MNEKTLGKRKKNRDEMEKTYDFNQWTFMNEFLKEKIKKRQEKKWKVKETK